MTAERERTHDADDQTLAYIKELEAANTQLHQEVRQGELRYQSAIAVNEQRRLENERLRRLLVAVLPPDAVYQEARALAKALREGRT